MTAAENAKPTAVPTLKQALGCWLHERWETELALRLPSVAQAWGLTWLDLRNRHERMLVDVATGGRVCLWEDTSRLTVARLFPDVGARLLGYCLTEWPVRFEPGSSLSRPIQPAVSVLIGVRGKARAPQFRAVIESLLGQDGCDVEIIVVEQNSSPELKHLVPATVRYVYSPCPDPAPPYNRSWAFNVAAHEARGRYLILHDADMIAPTGYAASVAAVLASGLDAVRLPRLLFYLDPPSSRTAWLERRFDHVKHVDRVVQNARTPIAISRDAYFRIGGHDESFHGWGGEDNEFIDRCRREVRFSEGAFLPLIHLWHPPAPSRDGGRNASHLERILGIPAHVRAHRLAAVGFGRGTPAAPWASA